MTREDLARKIIEVIDAYGDKKLDMIATIEAICKQAIDEPISEEQPEYSFFEYTYRCGKKPHWNIGDTLAYYELTSKCEGENILGKVTNVEFDEEYNDWFYTFDNGEQSDEETLLSDNTYKKN